MAADTSSDISLDDKPRDQGPKRFAEFYEGHAARLGQALVFCAQDDAAAQTALAAALAATAQRWKQISLHQFVPGWTYARGLDSIAANLGRQLRGRQPDATGGYVRGLDLSSAITALPLTQRAGLVATHYLDWSADQLAAGLGVPVATIETRYERAISFLVHHLKNERAVVQQAVTAHFATRSTGASVLTPPAQKIERLGLRNRVRNRLAAAALVVLLIAVGGVILRVSRQPPAPEIVETVDPPTASTDWFAPVSDGRGGFIALNARGASQFASSVDGVDWFRATTWNSRGIDIRTEVSSFQRSGGRYVVSVEAISSLATDVPPRIAWSDDLANWNVQALSVFPPGDSLALVPVVKVLSLAATPNDVLVAVGVEEKIDYATLGVRPSDVCVESARDDVFVLHLCDGTTIETTQASADVQTRFLLSQGGARFVGADVPEQVDPYSLFSFGSFFGARSMLDGGVFISANGMDWTRLTVGTGDLERLSLASGAPSGEWVVVVPGSDQWVSYLLQDNSAIQAPRPLPIDLDPQSVWIKPQLVHGPAGWALFVTTSRPWEQVDSSRGWAVDNGEWIVARSPNSDVISARRIDGQRSLRYQVASEFVTIDSSGAVELHDPASGELAVAVASEQIAETWAGLDLEADAVQSRVLFSADGIEWEPIWESTSNSWRPSIAVGDSEVVLTGATALGAPIRILVGEP